MAIDYAKVYVLVFFFPSEVIASSNLLDYSLVCITCTTVLSDGGAEKQRLKPFNQTPT